MAVQNQRITRCLILKVAIKKRLKKLDVNDYEVKDLKKEDVNFIDIAVTEKKILDQLGKPKVILSNNKTKELYEDVLKGYKLLYSMDEVLESSESDPKNKKMMEYGGKIDSEVEESELFIYDIYHPDSDSTASFLIWIKEEKCLFYGHRAMIDSNGNYEPQKEEKNISEDKVLSKGEWWEVEGQWKLTVNSVTVSDGRNKFSDKNPEEVVVIDYTYENLGYETTGQDLYITPKNVIDGNKSIASTYPLTGTNSIKPTPVGAIMNNGQQAYGLDNKSEKIQIHFEEYDSNKNKQKAVFEVTVD